MAVLTTRAAVQSYMRSPIQESDLMAFYATGFSTCTIAVDDVKVSIVTNSGTNTYLFATYATIGTLITAINLTSGAFFGRVIGGASSSDSTGLLPLPAVNCLAVANEQYLRGIDYGAVDGAISAASEAIERYTGKTFTSTAYEHFYDGTGRPFIQLRQTPVISVERVCVGRRDGLTIYNTLTDNSDATVEVTTTAIVLKIFGGTNNGSDSITISTNTLTQLVTSINAIGKGWVASVTSTEGASWRGTELFRRSPASARNSTRVSLYVPEVSDVSYSFDEGSGIIYRGADRTTPMWFGGTSGWGVWGGSYTGAPLSHVAPLSDPGGRLWPVGQFNVYVSYTAGYATIPGDLAMICNEAAANILRSGARDLTLRSESMQGYSWTASSAAMSDEVESWFTESIKKRLKRFMFIGFSPRFMAA